MTSSDDRRHPTTTLSLMTAYVVFGVFHELAHLAAASWLLPSQSFAFGRPSPLDASSSSTGGRRPASSLLRDAARAVLGRYSLIRIPASDFDQDATVWAIRRAGWVCSLALAAVCHLLHVTARRRRSDPRFKEERSPNTIVRKLLAWFNGMSIFLNPAVPFAAYVTAMEAIATDFLGFIPIHPHDRLDSSSAHNFIICFCGNFGVLLLNPSWLSVDGGRTALDILEKMVNVTMMRGTFWNFIDCMYRIVAGDIEY
jgi:hypothetical protein